MVRMTDKEQTPPNFIACCAFAHRVQNQKSNHTNSGPSEDDVRLLERRNHAISELFRTEATYLQVAVNIFMFQMLKPLNGGNPILSAEIVGQIFQNIEELLDINAELLKKMGLRKSQTKSSLGQECWADILRDVFAAVCEVFLQIFVL
jgi:hypothetical protein